MVKKFKMVFCQRLQKYVPFSVKNGKCMYQHKGPLCEGCKENHSFTLKRTCELLANECLEGGKRLLPQKKAKVRVRLAPLQKRVKKQVGSGPSQPLAKPSKTFQKT
jgi:hypothetical protein